MNRILNLIFFLLAGLYSSQDIKMEFPYFAGKTYDFIIFQGKESKIVYQGVIPSDGKFTLSVPQIYTPYRGMCRWLITGSEQGGGLDMVIPGVDFSVSCLSKIPNNDNIVYTRNDEMEKLNHYSQIQDSIFKRHDAMWRAIKSFSRSNKSYSLFQLEYNKQLKAYDSLQIMLDKDHSYASEFLRVVNITRGIGKELEEGEEKRAESIANLITEDLKWETLYTSGHWSTVISSWVDIHLLVLKNDKAFIKDFDKITENIRAGLYSDFAGQVAHILSQQGKDNLIAAITPIVLSSGKIEKYEGGLSVYKRLAVGSLAPDLVLTKVKKGKKETEHLKMKDLLREDYKKILLIFYHSGCGPCEKTIEELSKSDEKLSKMGVRIIGLSSDKESLSFNKNSSKFVGKEIYCDYEGLNGANFKNYGVLGTPTLVLIDQSCKIQLFASELSEVLSVLK
ncbi:peroxiredoxin family protein [Chryseobacterium cucumeris]|uniref:peroxiredoxin family protein n=1 Tax=Chryseobacterium cucumeris TaxID=1813611 RepID=UPI0007EFF0DB|nr:thioredoxin family protein [Chryseobacterium cucumeris]